MRWQNRAHIPFWNTIPKWNGGPPRTKKRTRFVPNRMILKVNALAGYLPAPRLYTVAVSVRASPDKQAVVFAQNCAHVAQTLSARVVAERDQQLVNSYAELGL